MRGNIRIMQWKISKKRSKAQTSNERNSRNDCVRKKGIVSKISVRINNRLRIIVGYIVSINEKKLVEHAHGNM